MSFLYQKCFHQLSVDISSQYIMQNSSNDSQIIISEAQSQASFIGAAVCSGLGLIVNLVCIAVILSRPAVRKHSATPLFFYQSLCDVIFSISLGLSTKVLNSLTNSYFTILEFQHCLLWDSTWEEHSRTIWVTIRGIVTILPTFSMPMPVSQSTSSPWSAWTDWWQSKTQKKPRKPSTGGLASSSLAFCTSWPLLSWSFHSRAGGAKWAMLKRLSAAPSKLLILQR